MSTDRRHQIAIVGGGTAGMTVAARLRRHLPNPDIAVIEPSAKHYYQRLWTLVGAGVFEKEVTERDEASLVPDGAILVPDAVVEFAPDENSLQTRDGHKVSYEYLVVAPGIQIDWYKIKGLPEAIGNDGICSVYDYRYVDSTWGTIRNFRGGNAVFTQPSSAVKCGGAPQKIMYLAEDFFRKSGVRDTTNIIFASGGDGIFPVEKYRAALEKVVRRKQIDTRFRHELVEIRGKPLRAKYSGYTPCPIITGYGSLILAEFDYDKQPDETFPFDQAKERYSMWLLKKYGLPLLYWQGMLKGRV